MSKEGLRGTGRWLVAAFVALLFACSLVAVSRDAHASLPVDLDRAGSVTLTMQDPDTLAAVPGGSMTLYRVADVQLDNDADYSFALASDFAGSGESLESLDAEVAARLASYAQDQGISGTEQTIGETGTVTFSGLTPGLFLVVQEQAAEGYYAVAPFLVSVPLEDGGTLLYDVNATPKMELLSHSPDEPGTPDGSGEPTTGTKTGDAVSVWPWVALAVAACAAIVVLLLVRRRQR